MKNTKKLAAIKKKIGMTNSAIGAKVGVDQSTVYRIFDGQIWPNADFIERFKRLSKGEVTANDWHAGYLQANKKG